MIEASIVSLTSSSTQPTVVYGVKGIYNISQVLQTHSNSDQLKWVHINNIKSTNAEEISKLFNIEIKICNKIKRSFKCVSIEKKSDMIIYYLPLFILTKIENERLKKFNFTSIFLRNMIKFKKYKFRECFENENNAIDDEIMKNMKKSSIIPLDLWNIKKDLQIKKKDIKISVLNNRKSNNHDYDSLLFNNNLNFLKSKSIFINYNVTPVVDSLIIVFQFNENRIITFSNSCGRYIYDLIMKEIIQAKYSCKCRHTPPHLNLYLHGALWKETCTNKMISKGINASIPFPYETDDKILSKKSKWISKTHYFIKILLQQLKRNSRKYKYSYFNIFKNEVHAESLNFALANNSSNFKSNSDIYLNQISDMLSNKINTKSFLQSNKNLSANTNLNEKREKQLFNNDYKVQKGKKCKNYEACIPIILSILRAHRTCLGQIIDLNSRRRQIVINMWDCPIAPQLLHPKNFTIILLEFYKRLTEERNKLIHITKMMADLELFSVRTVPDLLDFKLKVKEFHENSHSIIYF